MGSGTTVYKKVEVDVYWTAPPVPVKHARLTTFVAKQYAGPQTTNLGLSPMDNAGIITAKPVVMTVTVAPADVNSMAVNGSAKGKVVFYVFSAVNGLQVATFTVNTGDAGNSVAGTYTWTWDAATAEDGDYSFRAQAYSTSGDAGNIWQRTATLLTAFAPPKVTGITTSPGDGRVTLNWAASTATDFDHYEVWMGTAPGAASDLGLGQLTANSYIKTGLTNDETYYFVVYAVDVDGNKSPASDEVEGTPTSMPGVNRPSMPGGFTAVAVGNTAKLTWTTSTQDGTSTLSGYYIYRNDLYTPYATVDAGATTWLGHDRVELPHVHLHDPRLQRRRAQVLMVGGASRRHRGGHKAYADRDQYQDERSHHGLGAEHDAAVSVVDGHREPEHVDGDQARGTEHCQEGRQTLLVPSPLRHLHRDHRRRPGSDHQPCRHVVDQFQQLMA